MKLQNLGSALSALSGPRSPPRPSGMVFCAGLGVLRSGGGDDGGRAGPGSVTKAGKIRSESLNSSALRAVVVEVVEVVVVMEVVEEVEVVVGLGLGVVARKAGTTCCCWLGNCTPISCGKGALAEPGPAPGSGSWKLRRTSKQSSLSRSRHSYL